MGNLKDKFDKILEHADQIAHAVVRKSGSQWCVFSKDGKKLQCFKTKKEAQDRLRQIEFFKHRDGND